MSNGLSNSVIGILVAWYKELRALAAEKKIDLYSPEPALFPHLIDPKRIEP